MRGMPAPTTSRLPVTSHQRFHSWRSRHLYAHMGADTIADILRCPSRALQDRKTAAVTPTETLGRETEEVVFVLSQTKIGSTNPNP